MELMNFCNLIAASVKFYTVSNALWQSFDEDCIEDILTTNVGTLVTWARAHRQM